MFWGPPVKEFIKAARTALAATPAPAGLREALASLDRVTDLFGFHLQRIGYRDEETDEAIEQAQRILAVAPPPPEACEHPPNCDGNCNWWCHYKHVEAEAATPAASGDALREALREAWKFLNHITVQDYVGEKVDIDVQALDDYRSFLSRAKRLAATPQPEPAGLDVDAIASDLLFNFGLEYKIDRAAFTEQLRRRLARLAAQPKEAQP
jgi:hypothetical protein